MLNLRMFIFGHIGIGRKLVNPWSHQFPSAPLIIGMLLPDLIDKPLYYARVWDFISCTRTLGHTGAFLVLILVAAYFLHSRGLAALGMGVATHVLLDCLMDGFGPGSAWIALTWPIFRTDFAHEYSSIASHIARLWVGPVVTMEIIGLALIGWDLWKSARPNLRHESTR
jgi:hypothetical protein